MAGSWRSYTDQERAEAVGRALAVGAKRAALELSIPRRTISSWLQAPTPGVQGAIIASADAITATLEAAATEGSASLLALIRDPKTPARVKVDAIGLALQQWTLASGRATSRAESYVTEEQRSTTEAIEDTAGFLRAIVGSSDDELRKYLAEHGIQLLQQIAAAEASRVG